MRQPRLVFVTTLPVTAYLLLRGQLKAMREAGFDVHIVSSPGPDLTAAAEREGITAHAVTIPREIDPARDPIALAKLTRLFRRLKPDIVNASTPKAGLLGMMAARLARVPIRYYLLRGLRLETTEGRLQQILGTAETLTSACAHEVVCVSHSLRRAYLERGHVSAQKSLVIGAGSSNGVDPTRFERTSEVMAHAAQLRTDLGIPPKEPIIGFVGRMVADKGIDPLLDAYELLLQAHPDAHLMMVGDSLAGDSVQPAIRTRVKQLPGVHVLPRMETLAPFYAACTVLAFPSFREGFPNVPVEAAAAEIPVVGFPSTGVVDAIEDGVTGRIVPRGAGPLAGALAAYLSDPGLCAQHGAAGRERVQRDFIPRRIWDGWIDLYSARLAQHGLPLPSAQMR